MPSVLVNFIYTIFQNGGVNQFKPEVVTYLWEQLIFEGRKGFSDVIASMLVLSQDTLMRSDMDSINPKLREAAAEVTVASLEADAKWRRLRS